MTKAKAIAKNNPVDTATMEKFLAAKTHVGYKHNAAGAKIWYELDLAQIGDTKISKATAAELLKNGFGLTIETYLAAQEQWVAQELARTAAQIAQDDRNEIISTPRVRQEAMEVAVNAELEQANAQPATGYIFTKIKIVTGFGREGHSTQVERHDTKCKTLGDAFHFEGVYRELTFFDDNCNEGWELKTASGKLIAEGKTSAEAKKVRDTLCNPATEETDGSEDDADEETIVAVIPAEDNDYDETDEPEILNADLFVNLYHNPIQERYASVTRSINGEQLHFF
ncbi:MAG: hypothetical protein II968_01600, partial [Selenomonadaceae bacterium]|nr:hypothetical protein [Selenomonadaceae bacterium]